MRGALAAEVQGWREALSDRGVVLVLLLRAVGAALSAAVGILVAGHAGPLLAVLVVSLGCLGASLVWLRAIGRL